MPGKLFLFILLIFSIATFSFAQTKLDQLLKERSELYKNYEYYENQKSSFWGTKSKKDLKNIIGTLRQIIIKDSEIIKEINILNLQKNNKVLSKTQVSQDWSAELENENNKLKLLLRKATFDYNELKSEAEKKEAADNIKNTTIFLLIVSLIGLGIYIYRLRQSLKETKTRVEIDKKNKDFYLQTADV